MPAEQLMFHISLHLFVSGGAKGLGLAPDVRQLYEIESMKCVERSEVRSQKKVVEVRFRESEQNVFVKRSDFLTMSLKCYICNRKHVLLAQWIRHRSTEPGILGSTPRQDFFSFLGHVTQLSSPHIVTILLCSAS